MLATELYHDDIRVNCICPGLIRTKFAEAILEDEKATLTSTGAKRAGEPREIAGAVSYICSEDASYMTGESLMVTGGISARL